MPTTWRKRLGLPLVLIVALAFSLALPGASMAQSSIDDPTAAVYGDDDGGTTAAAVGGSSVAEEPGDNDGLNGRIGSLPFTGMDLIILAGVALVLTGTGFALRRASMPRGRHG